jgi:hypothetical protein
MGKLLSSVCLAVGVVLISTGTGLTQTAPDVSPGGGRLLPGTANCPTGTTETHRIPYARSTSGGTCETVITCQNLATSTKDFTAQFFFGFGNAQAGSDATVTLAAGESGEAATASTDPLGIFAINADAATGIFEGKARVCTENPQPTDGTAALACQATLVCSAGITTLNVIRGKQKGD